VAIPRNTRAMAAVSFRRRARGAENEWKRRLGNAVKRAREATAMSQGALASKIGVTTGTISEIERGVTAPSVPVAWKIADALETPLDVLLGRVDSRTGAINLNTEVPIRDQGRVRLTDAQQAQLRGRLGTGDGAMDVADAIIFLCQQIVEIRQDLYELKPELQREHAREKVTGSRKPGR